MLAAHLTASLLPHLLSEVISALSMMVSQADGTGPSIGITANTQHRLLI